MLCLGPLIKHYEICGNSEAITTCQLHMRLHYTTSVQVL